MEVDATIQEDLSENDGECGVAMRLAVSDDEDDGGSIGGGCRVADTSAMMARASRANGGASDMPGSGTSGKRKLHNDLQHLTREEGDKLYGFDEKTGKPTYGPVDSTTDCVSESDPVADVKSEEVPIKKSRPSEDAAADNILQVSSSTSPSAAASTSPVAAPIAARVESPVAAPVAVAAAVAPPKAPKPTKEELYRKPFAFGWKREVVYRANPDLSKDKADVYFISPSGKKMRSKTEITPLLEGDLTIEHFCFTKEPLGLGAEFEIVRSAKPTHRATAEVLNNSTTTSSGKRVSKPKAPKGASPPPQGWTPTRALKNSSSLNANSNSNAIGSTSSASPKATPKSSKNRKVGEQQPCTMQCAAAMGAIPQLQCIKCLCLYHHECVGLDRKDAQYARVSDGAAHQSGYRKDYVCQSCLPQVDVAGLKENQLAAPSKHHSPLPHAPQPPSHSPTPPVTAVAAAPSPVPSPVFVPSPAVPPPPPSAVALVAPAPVVPKSVVPIPEPAVGDLPQSIAVIKGKKYVVVKKLIVPRSSNVATAPNAAAAATAENNSSEASAENETGPNERSKRQYSSNSHRKNTSAAAAATSTTAATAAAHSSSSGATVQSSSSPGNGSGQLQYSTRLADSSSAAGSTTSLSFASNFFANVAVGYGAILHILKYLKIHERPRAASVCKIWNLVAKDRSLWQTVRMKNSKVSNWAGFTAALRRGETRHLDLRKLLVSSTKLEETWSEFCKHIGTVASLEHIDMCRCSAQVVQNLFLTNPNLTILSALAINDDSLNLMNIDNLVMLQELRLRTLDKCTLEGDLTPLRSLKNLKHLTLSSVRQLGTKAIEVLGELNSLVSLELGECNDFDTRFTDSVLPKLSNLERLRLEIGQDQCRTLDILDSVAKLESLSQLEFVNFDIKPGFDDKLAQCTNIQKLLIIPTYISQSATTNNIVLNAVLKLQDTLNVFTWGVTVELLRVTALYVDQCEDSTRKERRHFDECIPVLKPVPGSVVAETTDEDATPPANAVPQIEILPLDKVEEILRDNLATTKFTIVKVPYHATWKQQLVE